MISVLLADDSLIMRKAIADLLKSDPEIQLMAEAGNFAQTIELISKLRPRVVVMDLHRGDENNVNPSQVKSCLNGSRLLAISWNDSETKMLAKRLGAVTLMDKLNLASELIPAIKQYGNAPEGDIAPDFGGANN